MGGQGKLTNKQSLYFRSQLIFGEETNTVDGKTSFLGLPAVLNQLSDCCGCRNSFYG